MFSGITDGYNKTNGHVFPINDGTNDVPVYIENELEVIDPPTVVPVFTTEVPSISNSVKKSAKLSLFNRNKEDKNQDDSSAEKKQPERKLKPFEIFKFADKVDILLIIIGSLAAMATGAATPVMMWLFLDVINGLFAVGTQSQSTSTTTSSGCSADTLNGRDPYDVVKGQIKWFCTLGACTLVAFWIAFSLWMITAERQIRRIRFALFESIMRQEMGWFDCRNAGELSSRLVQDLDIMKEGIGSPLAEFICTVARVTASIIYSLYTGWKLTLVFLSIAPLIVLSIAFLIKVVVHYTALELQAYSTANAIAQEVLGAIRTVTAFGGQKNEGNRYEKNLQEGKRLGIKKGFMFGLAEAALNISLYGGIAIIFWYGPYLIRTECYNYTAGTWIVIFMSCLIATFSFALVLPNLQGFAEANGSAVYIFDIIERQSKIDPTLEDGIRPSTLIGDIEFENVHFTYPARPEQSILNGVSMKIPSGKTVALCGSSGCGKSTSIQLAQRLYDPDQGKVLLDGQDLRTINLKWLRSQIGIVSQEPVLFYGSIEDNIRFGKPNATDEEVIQAAKMANAHDFIMDLPQNYKTSSGDKLSGGQKQRVAIARALVSNPRILLLDEATSALDNTSERVVQDALDRAKQGRTTIVIAHRLSTIRNADIIVSFEKGKVVEYGTHDQLMLKKGLYYELVLAQSENDKSNDNNKNIDDEKEEKLAKQLEQKMKTTSRSVSVEQRRQSKTSADIDVSNTNDNDEALDENANKKKKSFFQTPSAFKVMKQNKSEWYYLLMGTITSMLFGCVLPAFALVFAEVFGALAEPNIDKQVDEIRTYTYTIFLIGVAGAVCQLISNTALAKAGEELTARMRALSFRIMLKQEIGWFDLEENNLGALVSRLSSDAAALKGLSGHTLGAIFNALGSLIFALAVSFSSGWKLTLVLLSFTPLLIFSEVVRGKQTGQKFGGKDSGANDTEEGGKYATQAIENIRTVVALHQEEYFIRAYKEAFNKSFRREMVSIQYTAFSNALANSITYFLNALAFGYGIDLVKSKEMEYQNVFKVFSVITFASLSMGRSASMVPNYSKGQESAKRILKLNDRQSLIDPDDPQGITLPNVEGNIEFRDIKFRYPARPQLPVLRSLKLRCPPGVTTALVGPSGSGKSTTVAFIIRFYDPLVGTVLLDGHDVKTLNIQWLRSLIGLVQQEPTLFNLSIRDNIAYGDNTRQVSQEEIEAAAKKANIHNIIISLPQGYDTSCGAKGGQLSGGQKQRIAIARALVRQPKILLLDEATSALDNKSEKVVQAALDQAKEGRTCLTIAHRLATIQNSEQICVVDKGVVKESGTHQQLMQQQGIYYKLNQAQQRNNDSH